MKLFSKIVLGSLVLALGACGGGSSGSGSSSGVAKLKGMWKSTTYLGTINCGADGSVTNTDMQIITWSGGVSSDLVQTDQTSACILDADVTGYTATSIPGQSCLIHDADGDAINITLTAYSFSLSADYQTATEAGSGSAQVTFTDGSSATCTYTLQATYMKFGV